MLEILGAPATRRDATTPYGASPETCWGFRRGDVVASGRHVLRRLGDGGAHEAYLVETGDSDLAVAKLPRPWLAEDVHRLVSLRHEGDALSRLRSPAVPRHLDTVLSGPHPHLLMEYVAGPTLRTAIAGRGPLPAPFVAGLGHALALGPRCDRPRRLGPPRRQAREHRRSTRHRACSTSSSPAPPPMPRA